MDLSMSILQYQDYCSMIFGKELDAFWAELRSGTYQKKAISDYNKKYSLIDRLFGKHPEAELVKACKESIKCYKQYGYYHVNDKLHKLLIDPFAEKLSRKTDEMYENYEKCFLNEIEKESKICDKTLVKRIVNKFYNHFEAEMEKAKRKCYFLCVTDTVVEASEMVVSLSSLGIKPISNKFKQAGLATAVLIEFKNKYNAKFNEKIIIAMAFDSADLPEHNPSIEKGIYIKGKSYITMCLENNKGGWTLNI
ncbi:MAG: hypothetical protein NC240_07680 [Clostridium sp.]|nr:hypothetical protein [Clostridium sp.]